MCRSCCAFPDSQILAAESHAGHHFSPSDLLNSSAQLAEAGRFQFFTAPNCFPGDPVSTCSVQSLYSASSHRFLSLWAVAAPQRVEAPHPHQDVPGRQRGLSQALPPHGDGQGEILFRSRGGRNGTGSNTLQSCRMKGLPFGSALLPVGVNTGCERGVSSDCCTWRTFARLHLRPIST